MFKSILVAVDGSEPAARAVAAAAALARQDDARLTLLHVIAQSGSYMIPPGLEELAQLEHLQVSEAELIRDAGQRILDRAGQDPALDGLAAVESRLDWGDPASRIAAVASDIGADLIVIGRRGLGPLKVLLLGSVSAKVVQTAPCACMTVP